MKSFLEKVKHHRFGLLVLISLLVVSISFFTRLFLLIAADGIQELSILSILEAFLIGFFFDLINATYFIIPVLIYLWLCPERIYNKRWHKYVLNSILFFFTSLLIFNSISEWFFWEEFTTRFNFIAVDYLVYTTEVIGNIQQSYPIEWYIGAALAFSALIVYQFRSWT
ncbi:MAG TPA: hypothetical protein PKN99_06145 [Cyclobacteriaceae bacterium]|nr:hypothetical protein [Cyclobacteriaceae bacterium]HNP07185.1 hypothetical protein [Cyclobacteriaceae bacterium]